ncbi:hypothetical protein N2152v2_005013 [Parachlorella kessleri]
MQGRLVALLVLCAAALVPRLGPSRHEDQDRPPSLPKGESSTVVGSCLASQGPATTLHQLPAAARVSPPAEAGTFIVRFKEYRMAEEHLQRLERALVGRGLVWHWVHRRNAASTFPTDFGLLRLGEPVDAARGFLSQLGFVKGVHPDRKFTRAPLWASPRSGDELQPAGEQPAASATGAAAAVAQQLKGAGGQAGSVDMTAAAARQGVQQQVAQHEEEEGAHVGAYKRPGRLQTRPTFSLEDNVGALESDPDVAASPEALAFFGVHSHHRVGNDSSADSGPALQRRARRLQSYLGRPLPVLLGADKLWLEGFRGQTVKVGVFDTGVRADHPHIKHIKERTNWTHEPTLDDGLGHGSFVAGVVASRDPQCSGVAPEVDLHTFRVFTNDQVSYTSWFLDAFNYAIATQMDVVNLSIGGPDYLDEPFVEKVQEITSNGILMVSAIGNDGPLYGTLNNPADQNDVIGVGGIDFENKIASFSSRGMSTWELPLGYGRPKPDVMAFGRDVQLRLMMGWTEVDDFVYYANLAMLRGLLRLCVRGTGSRINGGCRTLSGTSVASPVVAGVVALLASVVPEDQRWELLNPASMKQALVEGATRLPQLNMYEQGQGKVNILASKDILANYVPRASVVPSKLDLTDCPFMWPFCTQPLYAGAMPVMFNATILNGQHVTGKLDALSFEPTNPAGRLLDVDFEYSGTLWPWSGFLAIYLRVRPEGAGYNGTATGEISFAVVSPPRLGQSEPQRSLVSMQLVAHIIPTPPRHRRVLWDQFHSIRYPPAYFPRDDLQVRHDILDWHGDHPHTNFHDMYNFLRENGYYLEVLASPVTCFNATQYGALMIVDPEDEFYPEEVTKLEHDIKHLGLGLLVFGEWYDEETLAKLRFYDDNTRSWWEAATGGANIPALNDLLVPYGVAFGRGVLEGSVQLPGMEAFKMASGTRIAAFPAGGHVHKATLVTKQGSTRGQTAEEAALGLLSYGAGRLSLFGDSNCLDSSHQKSNCHAMLKKLLEFATEGGQELLSAESRLLDAFGTYDNLPYRRSDYNFTAISPVLSTALRCYPNSPRDFHTASFSQWAYNLTRPPIPPPTLRLPTEQPAAGQQQQQQGEGESQPQGQAQAAQQDSGAGGSSAGGEEQQGKAASQPDNAAVKPEQASGAGVNVGQQAQQLGQPPGVPEPGEQAQQQQAQQQSAEEAARKQAEHAGQQKKAAEGAVDAATAASAAAQAAQQAKQHAEHVVLPGASLGNAGQQPGSSTAGSGSSSTGGSNPRPRGRSQAHQQQQQQQALGVLPSSSESTSGEGNVEGGLLHQRAKHQSGAEEDLWGSPQQRRVRHRRTYKDTVVSASQALGVAGVLLVVALWWLTLSRRGARPGVLGVVVASPPRRQWWRPFRRAASRIM